ncbi:MAG: GAF domain-containing protein [Pseudomonadota bacterium]
MSTMKEYFQTFCNLSQAFGTAATIDDLLTLIVRNATETMSAKGACLFLAEEKKNVFVPMASFGLSDNYMHANPITAKKLVKAIQKTGFLFFEDATTDPRLENHEAKRKEGIASILTVAVVANGRTIGILSVYTAEKRPFTENDIFFIKSLAANGAIAIEKGQLLKRIKKNASLFLELSSEINSSIDIKDVLHSMTEKTCTAFGMKGVAIFLFNEETNTLDIVASHGLSETFLNKGVLSADISIAPELKGKVVVTEDVSKDGHLQYPKETRAEGINSMVCLPIQSKEKIIGAMRLYSDSVRNYPEDFILVVQALTHAGALAIQNAAMYLSLQEDNKSLIEDIWSHRLYF